MNETAPIPTTKFDVQLGEGIAEDLADYTRGVVERLPAHRGRAGAPAHVHVVRHTGPGRDRPVTARIVVDLDGTAVATHVAADHPREAVDLLVDRPARRMERLRRTARDGGHGLPGPHLRDAGSPDV